MFFIIHHFYLINIYHSDSYYSYYHIHHITAFSSILHLSHLKIMSDSSASIKIKDYLNTAFGIRFMNERKFRSCNIYFLRFPGITGIVLQAYHATFTCYEKDLILFQYRRFYGFMERFQDIYINTSCTCHVMYHVMYLSICL